MRPKSTARRQKPAQRFKPSDFIARTPVFRLETFRDAHVAGGRSARTSAALLAYHVAHGNLRAVRRGLYARGGEPVDPWLLGSRLTRDAVLAYDGALSFHRLSPLGHGIAYLTRERPSFFHFNEVVYTGVRVPKSLASARWADDEVLELERQGLLLKVTSVERTLVDLLDRLDLAPKVATLRDLFKTTARLDVERMVSYALRLGHRATAARLGVLLAHHPDVDSKLLWRLEPLTPSATTYFNRAKRSPSDRYVARWRTIVPGALLQK